MASIDVWKEIGSSPFILCKVTVEIIKVDKNTLKHTKFNWDISVPVMEGESAGSKFREKVLTMVKSCNVGDFVRFSDGAVYRRIVGGFREATSEDLAELITSEI